MQLSFIKESLNKKDVVYTADYVSKKIIEILNPSGWCLDPCKGDGSFYNNLPIHKDYCEIDEGKDFFEYDKKMEWIIGNPPYSLFEDFLRHSFFLAWNVSFIVPINKVFQRQLIMNMINKFGGIRSIIVFGSGQKIGFPFGFSVANFHFQKEYKGATRIISGMNEIFKTK